MDGSAPDVVVERLCTDGRMKTREMEADVLQVKETRFAARRLYEAVDAARDQMKPKEREIRVGAECANAFTHETQPLTAAGDIRGDEHRSWAT